MGVTLWRGVLTNIIFCCFGLLSGSFSFLSSSTLRGSLRRQCGAVWHWTANSSDIAYHCVALYIVTYVAKTSPGSLGAFFFSTYPLSSSHYSYVLAWCPTRREYRYRHIAILSIGSRWKVKLKISPLAAVPPSSFTIPPPPPELSLLAGRSAAAAMRRHWGAMSINQQLTQRATAVANACALCPPVCY